MQKKYLYIPVEIKVRELPAKILLATEAAKRGYHVVIGRKAEIMSMIQHVPPGIFLGSWAGKNFENTYKSIKQHEHTVAVMDEEGLVTFSDSQYARFKLSDDTLNYIDLFFTWGAKQIETIQTHCKPEKMPELIKSGNVRLDILQSAFHPVFAKEINNIKNKYGNFILLNSSFGRGNHFKGSAQNTREQVEKKIIQNGEDLEFLESYTSLQKKMIKSYLDAIPRLRNEFPHHKIVIRPHPSENVETWRSAIHNLENVYVDHDGAVHNWLLACDAVIHHFCTTALEAYVADIPSVAYRPHKNDNIETNLPYLASIEATDQDSLIMSLKSAISKDDKTLEQKREQAYDTLNLHIENLKENYAYKTMLDAFDNISIQTDIPLNKAYFTKRRFGDALRSIKRRLINSSHASYVDHKFKSLSRSELRGLIDSINSLSAQKHDLQIKLLSRTCFLIKR